jgi:Membrane domain of glycerophosphoryl diester phosphodiesterase
VTEGPEPYSPGREANGDDQTAGGQAGAGWGAPVPGGYGPGAPAYGNPPQGPAVPPVPVPGPMPPGQPVPPGHAPYGYGAPPPGYGSSAPAGGYGQPPGGGYGAYGSASGGQGPGSGAPYGLGPAGPGGPGSYDPGSYGSGPYGAGPYGPGSYGSGPYGAGPHGGNPYGGGPYGGGPYGGYGAYGGGPYGGGPYGRPPAPKPGIIPLRPLGIGDILDGAFTAIRWNPKTILGSSAIVAAISNVLLGIIMYILERDLLSQVDIASGQLNSGQTPTASQLGDLGAYLVALGGATLIFTVVSNAILTGVLTLAIGQAVLGKKETLGSAWRATWPRFWALLGAVVLPGLFVLGGAAIVIFLLILLAAGLGAAHALPVGVTIAVVGGITAVVFAIIFYIRWYVTIPALMLEGVGPLRAMGRSWRLVRRSWWRTWWIGFLASLIAGFAGSIIKLPLSAAVGGGTFSFTSQQQPHVSLLAVIVTSIGGIIASTLTTPLIAGVTVLIYADLRMRREGMDITLQAAAAAGDGGQGSAAWTPGAPGPAGFSAGSPSPGAGGPGMGAQGTGATGGAGPASQNPGPW